MQWMQPYKAFVHSQLIVLNFAKEHTNRAVEHYGCLPTKKLMYEWKKSQRNNSN